MSEKILKMYFEDKMKQVEIAKKLNVPKYKVSRIVTKDSRYQKEKEDRKEKNKNEHKIKTKNYIYEKRKKKKDDITYEQLKQMHIQASKELSDGKIIISDIAFLKWNLSAYKYNPRKKRYEFDKKLGKSYAVPKYIKFK